MLASLGRTLGHSYCCSSRPEETMPEEKEPPRPHGDKLKDVAGNRPDEFVAEIFEILARHDGRYDGWGAESRTRHR